MSSSASSVPDEGSGTSTPLTVPSMTDNRIQRAAVETAIVGMACRLPGAKSPEQLWKNIIEKKDLQRQIPADRFNIDAYYHPDGTHKGTMNARYGYFLDDDIREFDPEFFQISGKEAEAMDPQQRMLLEVVYEALENAGITLDDISGTDTSVFCGCFTNDYREMTYKDIESYPKYCATGTGMAILSNRISYFYNLHGASVTMDTACSSSLVGLHMGNMSIRNGESDISIIVGSALHFDPTIFTTMTDLGFLSSDGRCRAFDVDAKGYVRGEGVCAVILKNRFKALQDGDNIRAVVKGTLCNHDGTKEGITMPNSVAQEALIRKVYKDAGLSTHETTYFEAHGTGTQAGDPRETRAIGSVFAPGRDHPLYVGSIKTNIGHLEGASGLAGVIKTVMSLEAGTILPNMHFNSPNPNIDFKNWQIQVPTAAIPWPSYNGVRRGSINSFGYGGTNAHVIVEQYTGPRINPTTTALPDEFIHMTANRPLLLPLSTHTEKAGKLLKSSLASAAGEDQARTTGDFAYSLSNTRRTHHRYRSYAIAAPSENAKDVFSNAATSWKPVLKRKPRIGFVFTGQGAQWYNMGRELFEKSPLFRQLLLKCERVLMSLENPPTWSIFEELSRSKEDTNVNQLAFASALSPSLQICLVELLKAWGISPSAVCGHSAGEIAASYAAGIISFEDAIACAWYRGTAFNNFTPPDRVKIPGAMIAVGMSEADANIELEKYTGKLCVAAINSPSSLTISGDMPECLELKKSLEDRKIFVRRLQIPQAYHSHHMVPHAPELLRLTKHVKGRPQTCRMFSSVTGRLANGAEMGGKYFCDNLVSAVRFSDALTGTVLNEEEELNVDVLVEIGAHPALKGPSRQTLQLLKIDLPYIGTITRDQPDFKCLLECVGQLYALGYPVDLEAVNSNLFLDIDDTIQRAPVGKPIKLPSYAWDHGKYWSETRYVSNYRKRKERHAFLGAQTYGDVERHPRWRVFLRPRELPWLMHHMIDGKVIFPAAGYLSMAIEAGVRIEELSANLKSVTIRDVNIKSALTVSESDEGTEALLEMQPLPVSAKRVSDTEYRFTISSYSDNGMVSEHCSGIISVQKGEATFIAPGHAAQSFKELQKVTNKSTEPSKCYESWQRIGLGYGQSFQLLNDKVDSGSGVALSRILLNAKGHEITDYEQSIVHPSFLDASFHPFFESIESLTGRPLEGPWVPTFIKHVKVSGLFAIRSASRAQHNLWTTTETELPGPRTAVINVKIRDETGDGVLIDVKGLEATTLGSSGAEDDQFRSLFFRTRWQPLFGQLAGTKALAELKDMPALIDIFAHERSNAKILHITDDLNSTASILKPLMRGHRRRFANLTIVACAGLDETALLDFESNYSDLVNHNQPSPSNYDLVIVSKPTDLDIQSFLCPEGYVVAHHGTYESQASDLVFETDEVSVYSNMQKQTPLLEDLTIVLADRPSNHSQEICSQLVAQRSGNVRTTTLRQLGDVPVTSTKVLVLASLDQDILLSLDEDELAHFEAIKALMALSNVEILWVLCGATMESSNPAQALINGMARSARNENDRLTLKTMDISAQATSAEVADYVQQVFNQPIEEDELVVRHGTFMVPRVEADDILNAKLPSNARNDAQREFFGKNPLSLKIGKVGLLETLTFGLDEEIIDNVLAEDEVEIEVKASAINFRDVAASMGIIDDYRLGDECAGVVLKVGSGVPTDHFSVGDRIVAFRPGQGAHRTIVRNHWTQCHKLNDSISFTHAAALPLVTTTAYYALIDLARLQKSETVLIHAAAGGVGQMAIQLAQMLGAKVIATCSSPVKRELLKSAYGLPDDHILSSRDTSFAKGVMTLTGGRGVDVVLNSLAGELLHLTWSCIARFGRFIEIGKRDIHENASIEMDPFRKNVLFASAELITMWEYNKPLSQRLLQDAFRLFETGKIRIPESVLELPYSEVEKGFRLLQMGKHTGKIVLVPHQGDLVPVSQATYRQKDLFKPDSLYLLVGGLGGLGRTLSQWMVRKGARRLAFMSRSGESKPEAQATIAWLRARDIEAKVYPVDVTNTEQVSECIRDLGPDLAGIFHAAVVLQDVPLASMSAQQWRSCLDPKVKGAWNLHTATQSLDLDFFVTFSSLSCQLGGAGQANYSAANAYLDALMRSRRNSGLRGTTMNVGAITGAGLVAENEALLKFLTFMGYDMVNEDELLFQIEEAIVQSGGPVSDDRGTDLVGTITGINLKKKDYYWSTRSFFKNLYQNHDLDNKATVSKGAASLSAQLKAANTFEARTAVLTDAFIEKTAAVLGADVASIQPTNPLSMYGLDSIVAVEFRKWFAKTINVDVALFDILSSSSIDALVSKAAALMVIADDTSSKDNNESSKPTNSRPNTTTGAVSPAAKSPMEEIAVNRPRELPMSNFQRRLWFAHQMAQDKATLNIAIAAYMKGVPNFVMFKAALDEWKKRNEMARVMYFEGDDFPEQRPIDDFDSRIDFVDLSSNSNAEAAADNLIQRLQQQPLDIENGEVFRATFAKLGAERYAFLTAWHHISIDRGSSKSSFEQITGIYEAMRNEKDLATVPAPRLSYIDFSVWYEQYLNSDAVEREASFWTKKLQGMDPQSKLLPFAKMERPEIQDLGRKTVKFTIPLNMLNRLKRVCSRMAATPFHFLLAAFRAFLYRYTEEQDATILIIDGNRPHNDLDDVMGFYVNMVPVRLDHTLDGRFDELVTTTRKASVEALEHNKMPFDAIVERMNFPRSTATFPISQIVMNYQMHGKMPRFATKDFEITDIVNYDIPSACELAIEALEDPERGMDMFLAYSTKLYSQQNMERFWDNYMTFVTDVIQDHMQPIGQVKIAGVKEIQHLTQNFWNMQTIQNLWEGISIVEKISVSAATSPNSIAISSSDGQRLTYRELKEQAGKIAGRLSELGVTTGTSVGVLASPGVEAIVAMVGALYHGCGYVALDPEFAAHRLAFMVNDSYVQALLVGEALEPLALSIVENSTTPAKLVSIAQAKTGHQISRHATGSRDSPFYTIYTSGSTGTPKGVVLTQANTHQMLATMNRDYSFTGHDRFLQQSSLCFDLSIVQIFSALTCGATVCCATSDIRKDPSALAAFMQQQNVTVTYFTPTHFSLLIDSAASTLTHCRDYRISYFAGERLPARVVDRFYALGTPATIYNTWSPSELVVQTAIAKVTREQAQQVSIPIGYPMANCRHYILDPWMNPLPQGFIGELCVGGGQVGAGYLNRHNANSLSFVQDPFCSQEDRRRGWSRLFRTGDKGRFLPDGQLEFHGRIAGDKQVKLRGFRVDLGEVEHSIYKEAAKIKFPSLKDVYIVARPSRDASETDIDDRAIIAFLVVTQSLSSEEKVQFVTDIHRNIAKYLNAYMLPAGYEFLDQMPLTIGRKVDRQNLLKRPLSLVNPNSTRLEVTTSTEAMEGQQQRILNLVIQAFRETLKFPAERSCTAYDNFFEIGGQSILFLRLQAKLKRSMKTIPPLSVLFKAPTPLLMSRLIYEWSTDLTAAKCRQTQDRISRVDWVKEAFLPDDVRYQCPPVDPIQPNEIRSILVTGLESFIGVHVLAKIITTYAGATFHILGTEEAWETRKLLERLDQMRLFDHRLNHAIGLSTIDFVQGSLMEPHFGLEYQAFKELGTSIQAIYHMGVQVSLLKSYAELKRANVNTVLDIIELASYGKTQTSLHCLSTWSVPHLQSHQKTKLIAGALDNRTIPAAKYEPSDDAELFYFKSRWVAEKLLTSAAERGFDVSIFRASAVSGNTKTAVPPPQEDLVKQMIVEMVDSAQVPDFKTGANSKHFTPPFVIDFVPVDYVADSLVAISSSPAVQRHQLNASTGGKNEVKVYHICNPQPLLLRQLAELIPQVRPGSQKGSTMDIDAWLTCIKDRAHSEEQKLRAEAAKAICESGHVMFAIDTADTLQALDRARQDGAKVVACPPMDAEFLKILVG
ncbi:hypothetical protein LTS08_004580 [Lithohypha guttulata]|nr:hypothetical protein LTS08_004580 [Lithohypha guttulata]